MSVNRRHILITSASGVALVLPVKSAYALEPITAGWVGMKLLEGAIAWVGGQLLSSALGAATITDIRGWIAAAVAEIEAFVSEELRRQLTQLVLDEMRADLQGVIQLMNQYASLEPSSRVANRTLLEDVNTITATRIPRVSKYDQALPILATFMAYRLIGRMELFVLDKDPGHVRSMRAEIDAFVVRVKEIRATVGPKLEVSARLKSLGCKPLPRSEGTRSQAGCEYEIDGQRLLDYTDPPRRTSNMIDAEVRGSLQKQHDTFVADANGYLSLCTTCYDAMCRKIGDTYPIEGGTAGLSATRNRLQLSRITAAPSALVMPVRMRGE